MPTPYRKKLIEVALPLKAINEASAREKSIRHGHPSTLHLWWARRPLAACRAVLFASLVDDPDSDPAYQKADGTVDEDRAGVKRAELFNLIEELVQWENSNNPRVINAARAEIARCVASRKIELGELGKQDDFGFGIADFGLPEAAAATSQPPASSSPKSKIKNRQSSAPNPQSKIENQKSCKVWDFMKMSAAPEAVNAFLAAHAPPVLDPFCGGGSIPLEAQRLGLRAYASDLNPVPVLITKALIEIPPKFAGRPPVNPDWQKKSAEEKAATVWQGAQGLAEDVRYYGKWMRDEAEKRIGHLYPKVEVTEEMAKDRPDLLPYVGQKLTVIAWLWARTVASPNPAVGGAHVPLVRSFWLSTKKGKEAYVEPIIDREKNAYRFEVQLGKPNANFNPGTGTVNRRGGTCILTEDAMPFPHIRAEGKAGKMQSRLMAIVAEGTRGRVYLSANEQHLKIALSANPTWRPEAELPDNPRDFKTPNYGMNTFGDLFTARQLTALTTFSDLVQAAREKVLGDATTGWTTQTKPAGKILTDKTDTQLPLAEGGTGPVAYADAVATYLAFGVSRLADISSSLASWIQELQAVRNTFARQALPMIWDYCECNPVADKWDGAVEWIFRVIISSPSFTSIGNVTQLDATTCVVLNNSIMSTDPPYYDNIGYADLSDFFYVWLRRSLRKVYPQLFATTLTPKTQELIASPYRHGGSKLKSQQFFESGLGEAFVRMHEVHNSDIPLTVYYAFKQSETDESEENEDAQLAVQTASTGWETMLAGLIRSGFSITGTWPVRTERSVRTISLGSNALASSIVLVCRPRPANAALATRKDFLNLLRKELPEALKDLQRGNVAPVDLAQAAIGPGMAVFTRYAKVVESDGSSMTVRAALGLINQTLDEVLTEQEGEFDADTRWALAWFEQFGMEAGPFGDAEILSKAKVTSTSGLTEAGIIAAKSGKVRLVKREELPADWNPATDKRLSVWEVTQHLIHRLDQQGESGAAALVQQLGSVAEVARDLAYRLYSTCERKKWAQEALAYNSLVVAWPELSKLALAARNKQSVVRQSELFS